MKNSLPWLRLYTDAYRHPKLRRLSDSAFRVWFGCLCLAGENDPRGQLPPVDDIALHLGIWKSRLVAKLAQLVAAGALDDNNGTLSIHNFDTRQSRSDVSTQRVRAHRERFQNVSETVSETHETVLEESKRRERGEESRESSSAASAAASEVVPISSPSKYDAAWFDAQHANWYNNAYWRRVGPKDSRRAYEKTLRKMAASEGDFERCAALLFDAAVNDRTRFENTDDWEWRQNLHPATWLNGERWNDEPKARGQPASQSKKVGFVESVRQEFAKELAREGKLC